MNNIKSVASLVVCLCLIVFGYVRGCQDATARATALLIEEQAAHSETKNELQKALATGMQWKISYDEMQMNAEAVGKTATACLAREKDWQDALEQQESVFRETSIHPRTAEEGTHVADDATRRRAALVLNAGW